MGIVVVNFLRASALSTAPAGPEVTDRVGKLTAMRVVSDPEEEVLVISASGMVLRTPVGAISQIGRQTQGVIVMRLAPDDQVVAIAPVAGIEEGDGKD